MMSTFCCQFYFILKILPPRGIISTRAIQQQQKNDHRPSIKPINHQLNCHKKNSNMKKKSLKKFLLPSISVRRLVCGNQENELESTSIPQ